MKRSVEYFEEEGRSNYGDVLRIVHDRAEEDDVDAMVVFAATTNGVRRALESLADLESKPLTIATFRHEALAYSETDEGLASTPIGISLAEEEALREEGKFSLVRAALPLSNEILVLRYGDPKLSGIREALKMFSGSMTLVVQAILVACDAGCLSQGQRVVAFSGDTAVLATAAHSDTLFFPDIGIEIHEILCKPARLTVTRPRESSEGEVSEGK